MKNNILIIIMALLFIIAIVGCKEDKATPRKGQSDAVFNPNLEYGTVTDIDGNTYKTIKIGTQTWMAQNLRVTHYQNGDPIPLDSTSDWYDIGEGVYCMLHNNTNVDTIATFGLIYSGNVAIDARNVAPKGWRVPSWEDVQILYDYLTSLETTTNNLRAGGRLKESGTKHWLAPNRADNSSGFTLLPTPAKDGYNYYSFNARNFAPLWTTTKFKEVMLRIFGSGNASDLVINGGGFGTRTGLAIRCIKNN